MNGVLVIFFTYCFSQCELLLLLRGVQCRLHCPACTHNGVVVFGLQRRNTPPGFELD